MYTAEFGIARDNMEYIRKCGVRPTDEDLQEIGHKIFSILKHKQIFDTRQEVWAAVLGAMRHAANAGVGEYYADLKSRLAQASAISDGIQFRLPDTSGVFE